MAKLYESDSKADETVIEGNLSEKLTFVRREILCDFTLKQFDELTDFFSYFICFVEGEVELFEWKYNMQIFVGLERLKFPFFRII